MTTFKEKMMREYKVGDKVMCNGYEGRIIEICTGQLKGMTVVRLDRGSVCVDIGELARFDTLRTN